MIAERLLEAAKLLEMQDAFIEQQAAVIRQVESCCFHLALYNHQLTVALLAYGAEIPRQPGNPAAVH